LVDPIEEIPSTDGLIDINTPDLVSSTDRKARGLSPPSQVKPPFQQRLYLLSVGPEIHFRMTSKSVLTV
jgi:hypothetical protein